MAYIINQSYGDFQQRGCLYKPTVAFNENPSTRGRLTGLRNRPQKQASAKADLSTFGSSVLASSYFIDETIH